MEEKIKIMCRPCVWRNRALKVDVPGYLGPTFNGGVKTLMVTESSLDQSLRLSASHGILVGVLIGFSLAVLGRREKKEKKEKED